MKELTTPTPSTVLLWGHTLWPPQLVSCLVSRLVDLHHLWMLRRVCYDSMTLMSLLAARNVLPLFPHLGMAQNDQRKRIGDLAVQAKNHMLLQFQVCPILTLIDLTFLVLCPHEPAGAKSNKCIQTHFLWLRSSQPATNATLALGPKSNQGVCESMTEPEHQIPTPDFSQLAGALRSKATPPATGPPIWHELCHADQNCLESPAPSPTHQRQGPWDHGPCHTSQVQSCHASQSSHGVVT